MTRIRVSSIKALLVRYCSVVNIAAGRPVAAMATAQIISRRTNHTSPYKEGLHRSNAEVLINKVPVIEVSGHVAVCDGGGGALGHPVEFIQLDTVSKQPAICKYCGLRFKMKAGGHHH